MNIHYLQHVPFEGLGSIANWVGQAGHNLTGSRLYAGEALPDPAALDWLIVMGGPMGVHDERHHPWLTREKQLIEQAIGQEKTVLGICLGAQLIADVLGARVYANEHREIGWFPVRRTSEAADCALGRVLPEQVEVFHWHGDTFDLPAGGKRLLQKADGYVATIKSGRITFRNGEPTGERPGKVIRGPQRAPLALAAE